MTALRVAITETKNVYEPMPERMDMLETLGEHLEEIRRANVLHNINLIEAARAKGAQVVGLGELCTAPYFALAKHEMWRAMAEDLREGPSVTEFCEAAKRLSVAIVAPLYELEAETQKRFNTTVVIDNTGQVLGQYRKTHIPNGENEQGNFIEPFYFGPAEGADPKTLFPVFDLGFAKIGVATCYDRHFEGVIRTLAQNGAELIFSPAVTFGQKSERMWEMEFEVDAARNNVFIAGSNRRGIEPPYTQPYFGNSYIVGPNGRPPTDRSHPNLVMTSINLSALHAPDPSGWNLTRDRRAGHYLP